MKAHSVSCSFLKVIATLPGKGFELMYSAEHLVAADVSRFPQSVMAIAISYKVSWKEKLKSAKMSCALVRLQPPCFRSVRFARAELWRSAAHEVIG